MTDLFANVNDGDFVRVEFEDGAIEGVVKFDGPRNLRRIVVSNAYTDVLAYQCPSITKITVLRRALPQEPPTGSVVLDKFGVAWQRGGAVTWFSTEILSVRIWLNLHADRGPLRVIYTPEER